MKKHFNPWAPIFILSFWHYLIMPTAAFGQVSIPFETEKLIELNIILEDNDNKPVQAKAALWEYTPPFKVDETFGLKWEDLDFSTIEQVFVGFELFKTSNQYLRLYHGKSKEFPEELYGKPEQFEKMMKKKRNSLSAKFMRHTIQNY